MNQIEIGIEPDNRNRTRIKLCGLTRPEDIEAVNEWMPDYIGFVFAKKSRRYVSGEQAAKLKNILHPGIRAVGVFVREEPEVVAGLLNERIIDLAQLHGGEDEEYIGKLRSLTDRPLIKAFRMEENPIDEIRRCTADLVLLDSGSGGTGSVFDWNLLKEVARPYFLAGGLNVENVGEAVRIRKPFGVDVSSGIETEGVKDREKIKQFVCAVRSAEKE